MYRDAVMPSLSDMAILILAKAALKGQTALYESSGSNSLIGIKAIAVY